MVNRCFQFDMWSDNVRIHHISVPFSFRASIFGGKSCMYTMKTEVDVERGERIHHADALSMFETQLFIHIMAGTRVQWQPLIQVVHLSIYLADMPTILHIWIAPIHSISFSALLRHLKICFSRSYPFMHSIVVCAAGNFASVLIRHQSEKPRFRAVSHLCIGWHNAWWWHPIAMLVNEWDCLIFRWSYGHWACVSYLRRFGNTQTCNCEWLQAYQFAWSCCIS